MFRSWVAFGFAGLVVAGAVALSHQRANAEVMAPEAPSAAPLPADSSTPAPPRASASAPPAVSASARAAPALPPLSGIELEHLRISSDEVTAPGPAGRVARLTVLPDVERAARKVIRGLEAHQAAVVLLEVSTGRVLAWVDYDEEGGSHAPCTEAGAPAASVFKIVTAAALVEQAGLTPDTRQCYSGGASKLTAADLRDDPKRDHGCATLAEAMGRSLNTVFARLALKSLRPSQLEKMGQAFGFGSPLPFDLPVAESEIRVPDDPLGFARTAAGFWNTTLSPLHGALLASTIANGGELVRPILVDSVSDKSGVLYRAAGKKVVRRVIRAETAEAITSMMEMTVTSGTSFHAFHDPEGRPFLPNISVAGKTGTLGRPKSSDMYTWFVGFAPSRAPEVAIAAQVVTGPKWRAKANVVAREVLQAYFAHKGMSGVSMP